MKRARFVLVLAALLCLQLVASLGALAQVDPLPSWNPGPRKDAILSFVQSVTTKSSPRFVPPEERIATFDNDGTLWGEYPMYVQFVFALDRVKVLAPQHPEWKTTEPFASLLKGDLSAALAGGERSMLEIVMATHAGMTTQAFEQIVKDWIATAKHPKVGRLYTEMTFQPMRELLAYLRSKEFKTFIVSGGGIEFMRPWTEKSYGVPPQQVVGSSIKVQYVMQADKPVLMRLPEINFIDDKEGKPIGIEQHIGRRPIAAFGNSDGDIQMLQWTCAGPGARLCMLVHHTDAEREYAYDKNSDVGRLDAGLEMAPKLGWSLINMKTDWKVIYPPKR